MPGPRRFGALLLVAGRAGLACVFASMADLCCRWPAASPGWPCAGFPPRAPDLASTQLAVDGVFAVVVAVGVGRLLRPGRNVLPHGRSALRRWPGWLALLALA